RAAPRMFPREFVEAQPLPGGGVAVIASGETRRCADAPDDGRGARAWCAGWTASLLDASGRVEYSAAEQSLTPPEAPHALVRLDGAAAVARGQSPQTSDALLYARADDRDATHTVLYSFDATGGRMVVPEPLASELPFWSRAALAWTGRELVAIGF